MKREELGPTVIPAGDDFGSVEIIMNADGDLVASVRWSVYTFSEPLPAAFGEWSQQMQNHFLKKEIVPKLIYLVKKAKANTLQQILRKN